MGNTPGKPHQRPKNKKYLQFINADRPSPPGRPYLVDALDATPDLLTVRWDPPLKNGGSPITGYLVEHRRTGSTHWVQASPTLVREPELTLGGLEPGWRYQFRVFAENVVGSSDSSELSEPLTITLQSARSAISAPKFTQDLTDTTVLENEKVEFVVHFLANPAPKLCWFKDGFEIFSSRRTRILTEHDRSVLTIHQAAICDEGEIKCTATNKLGHASIKARLTLEAPPSIRLPRQYEDGLLFEIGEMVRFKISVAGLPPPLIFWTHNGESINGSERYEIVNDEKTSTLKIAEAERIDRGEYQIKALNKLGSDLASFLVTVTDKPSPPGRAKVVMTLGRSVTLSWNTPDDDGGSKIGNYIVEYYRLGWNVWLKAATSRQLTTILGDLIEGSEYKFRVKAESPFGVSEPSEESELVFIPDPKRGMLEPKTRSRSQPRDIVETIAPIAKKRVKPRSHSSSRAGIDDDDVLDPDPPIKPARTIKSPPKTPERLSPHAERKEVAINKNIFDRATIARELSYGSPEFKMIKKTDVPIPKELDVKPAYEANQALQDTIKSSIQIQDKQKQKSPSPRPVKRLEPQPSRKELPEVPKVLQPQPIRKEIPPVPKVLQPQPIRKELPEVPKVLQPQPIRKEIPDVPKVLQPQPIRKEIPDVSKVLKPQPIRKEIPDVPKVLQPQPIRKEIPEMSKVVQPKIEAKPTVVIQKELTVKETVGVESPSRSPILGPSKLSKEILQSRLKEKSPSPRRDIYKERTPELRGFIKDRDNLGGSMEFMMVLYTSENPREMGSTSEFDFDLENSIAPPLSLSAPELGSDPPPIFDNLRLSCSSTELLHERAMVRFYQEALAEEEAIKRRLNSAQPRLQINEIERDGIGLERKHSLRRRLSAGGAMPAQLLMAQKRQSLRGSNEFSDILDSKPMKPLSIEEKRELMQSRQRSHSEEMEEEQFERIRAKMPTVAPKKKISVVQEEVWDYEESLSEEESSDGDESFVKESKIREITTDDDEEDTYHPNMSQNSAKYIEPFEILTKPAKLPEPNFVPKPILKKKETELFVPEEVVLAAAPPSPVDEIAPEIIMKEVVKPPEIIKAAEVKQKAEEIKQEPKPVEEIKKDSAISSVASAGMTAAGIVISQSLLQQKELEESISIIEHYGDLVRTVSKKQVRQPTQQAPDNTSIREALREQARLQAAMHHSDEEEEEILSPAYVEAPKVEVKLTPEQEKKAAREAIRQKSLQAAIDAERAPAPTPQTMRNGRLKEEPTNYQAPPRSATPIFKHPQQRATPEETRGRDQNRFGASKPRNVSQSKSPKASRPRKSSPSPAPKRSTSKTPGSRSTSAARAPKPSSKPSSRSSSKQRPERRTSSPVNPNLLRKPKMCEIMTQTSTSIEPPFLFPPVPQDIEELNTVAQQTVRSVVDYVTDLAMFAVACWLYIFSNELLALPVLLIAVYRQLKDEIKRRIPKWIKKRFNRNKDAEQ